MCTLQSRWKTIIYLFIYLFSCAFDLRHQCNPSLSVERTIKKRHNVIYAKRNKKLRLEFSGIRIEWSDTYRLQSDPPTIELIPIFPIK